MNTLIAGKEPFFSFIVKGENKPAMKAAVEFTEVDGHQLLCIYGEEGAGKSHLARIVRDMLDEEDYDYRMLTGFAIAEAITAWLDEGNAMYDFYTKYEKFDALIIDDIEDCSIDDLAQEALMNLIRHFWINGKKILILCNKHPKEMEWFKAGNLFIKVHLPKPGIGLRAILLKEYAYIAGMDIPEEIRLMVAEQIEDVRILKRIFNAAVAHQKAYNTPLTESLERLVRQYLKGNK